MHAHIQERIKAIQRGDVPPGYRKTKVGIIPKDWVIKNFADIVANYRLGGNYKNSETNTGLPLIKMGNVRRGFFSFERLEYIPNDEIINKDDLLREGDFLFNTRNTLDLVGKVAVWNNEIEQALYNSNLMKIDFKNDIVVSTWFMNYLFNSYSVLKLLRSLAIGTTSVAAIYTRDLLKLQLFLPPLPEQRRIAAILSAWDDGIRLQQDLIAQKQTQKRGLMQLLLTGAIRVTEMGRLSPEAVKQRVADIRQGLVPQGYRKIQWGIIPEAWNFLKIKEVAQQVIEFNSDNTIQKVLSCTKHDGLVDSLTYFKRQVFSEDLSKYKIVRRGGFAYATNHIEEGSIGLQNFCEAGLVSPMYTVFKTKSSVVAEFLYAVLKTETYRKIFEVHTSASINRRGSLRWNQFSLIRVPVPPLSEQQHIADILSTADTEIELLERELEQVRTQKKGLMQLLLSGAIRVGEC